MSFKHFEEEVKAVALAIRSELSKVESISRFSFEIEIEGRIDSDLKIGYRLGIDYESGITGNNIAAVVDEALRRRGWNQEHKPLMISHVTGLHLVEEANDEA